MMPAATGIMRRAVDLYRGSPFATVSAGTGRRLAASVLTTFFLAVGMPCMLLGTAGLWTISGRAARATIEAACCLVVLAAGALFGYSACAVIGAVSFTIDRCFKVFGGPT